LEETERTAAEEVYRRRFIHYHYVTNTQEYNKPHYDALTDPMCVLRSRLSHHASNPWEGETLELMVALIRATERWEPLTEGGAPCPVAFGAEDARETTELNEVQRKADKAFEVWQNMLGLGPEGWVPTKDYEAAMALCEQMKEGGGVDGGHVGEGTGGDNGATCPGTTWTKGKYHQRSPRYAHRLTLSRPIWDRVFPSIAEDVGVFFCGPAVLSRQLHQMSNDPPRGTRFFFGKGASLFSWFGTVLTPLTFVTENF
jgi:hypothetical protein